MEIINALGRRKKAVARVFLKSGNGDIRVNNKDYKEYFPSTVLQYIVEEPLKISSRLVQNPRSLKFADRHHSV